MSTIQVNLEPDALNATVTAVQKSRDSAIRKLGRTREGTTSAGIARTEVAVLDDALCELQAAQTDAVLGVTVG